MLGIPARTISSASPKVAQVTPKAPAFTWRSAISTLLWVLACGRRQTPHLRAFSAIRSMFLSNALRSRIRAGVAVLCRGAETIDSPTAVVLFSILTLRQPCRLEHLQGRTVETRERDVAHVTD